MTRDASPLTFDARRWGLARSGELKEALAATRDALSAPAGLSVTGRVELHLVAAFCLIRQGQFSEALLEIDGPQAAASKAASTAAWLPRIDVWRAEVAYFQGRYSAAESATAALASHFEAERDFAYAALALRIGIFVLLARAEYDRIGTLGERALRAAEASGDDYIVVQVLNVLGAAHFDRATSKLAQPHVRSHLTSLDTEDAAPMEEDARAALAFFERGRSVAERANLRFAAWYVAGNIERLEIVLGHAERAAIAIRKRLRELQARGAKYDEIVTRSNLAWALRLLGRHRDALHELEVALDLAQRTGTFNVMLEFLHYDRSIVLGALGDAAGARAAYRRYLRASADRNASGAAPGVPAAIKPPLEPYFMKRADRFIAGHLGERLGIERVARECGVSWRTLQSAFSRYRGVTPVAHIRNLRLDHAHAALANGSVSVSEVAARFAFRSRATFALEYRRRFGVPPSRRKREPQAT